MMRYDITLGIGSSYGGPSGHARLLVRVLPSDIPGQQLVTRRLVDVEPVPSERRETTDFFGNAMSVLAFHQPIDHVALSLTARVERFGDMSNLDLSPELPGLVAEVAQRKCIKPQSPHHFLADSARITRDPAIAAFARAQAHPGMTARQIVVALGLALNGEMRFTTGATDVKTTPSEAFANRHGVCQDFSHVMIAGLRALGIPAGYVSGFLRTSPPPGKERLEGADAMHAWVSAWCGRDTGWVEYDPTNRCFAGQDHVTVAYGRDYADVSPIKGALRTSGAQDSYQRVDVKPIVAP